jgi:hypothetical protein
MTGAAEFNAVFFTDVRVPQVNVVGGRGRGWFVANTTLKHERGMLGDPNATEARLSNLIELMKTETVDGQRVVDNPIFRDRLMQLQARVFSMKFNGLRTMTDDTAGLARMVVKLQGCELNHQVAALAIDALGELGILYHDGPHLRAKGSWQRSYMFDLGLIIGGGRRRSRRTSSPSGAWACRASPRSWRPDAVRAYRGPAAAAGQHRQALEQFSPLERVRRFADGGEAAAPDIWAGWPTWAAGLIIPRSTAGWAWACWRPRWRPRRWGGRGADAVPRIGGAGAAGAAAGRRGQLASTLDEPAGRLVSADDRRIIKRTCCLGERMALRDVQVAQHDRIARRLDGALARRAKRPPLQLGWALAGEPAQHRHGHGADGQHRRHPPAERTDLRGHAGRAAGLEPGA